MKLDILLCVLFLISGGLVQGQVQQRLNDTCPRTSQRNRLENGRCNNQLQPEFGSFRRAQSRLVAASYRDNVGQLNERNRPSARQVSNAICDQGDTPSGNLKQSSLLLIYFGQLLDHDMTLISMNREEKANIRVPRRDSTFSEDIEFFRSNFVEGPNGEREFETLNTAWLDLNSIYGDTQQRSRALRRLDGTGKMKTSTFFGKEFLPLNSDVGIETDGDTENGLDDEADTPEEVVFPELPDRNNNTQPAMVRERNDDEMNADRSNFCNGRCEIRGRREQATIFACGDPRCNENPVLSAYTLLFVREHNRLAEEFSKSNPRARESEIFQNARLRNIMQYQSIIFEEYLPVLLGTNTFGNLSRNSNGFDPTVDPNVNLFFSTAAYRYGHSGITDNIPFANRAGRTTESIRLSDVFFSPPTITDRRNTFDNLFNGLRTTQHETLDTKIVDTIRNELFLNVGETGQSFDLASFNIQRGRDHGLNTFNSYRESLGLEPFENCRRRDCFLELTKDRGLARKLRRVYRNDFDACDPWVCGLSEKPFGDSQLGETFTTAIASQFLRMRDGDRFFVDELRSRFSDVQIPVTLGEIIDRNTDRSLRNNPPAFLTAPFYATQVESDFIRVEWTGRNRRGRPIRNLNGFQLQTPDGTVEFEADERTAVVSNLSPGQKVRLRLSPLTGRNRRRRRSIGTITVTTSDM